MTDPLIDRDVLIATLADATGLLISPDTADAILDYLRSVLTSEALDPFHGHGDNAVPVFSTGDNLHRRIFGED